MSLRLVPLLLVLTLADGARATIDDGLLHSPPSDRPVVAATEGPLLVAERARARRTGAAGRRENRIDRREDVRDRRENRVDRREDVRDRREDRVDHREDVRDRREDRVDRREDVRDRRESLTGAPGPQPVTDATL